MKTMHQMDDATFDALNYLLDFLDGMVDADDPEDTIHCAYDLLLAWATKDAATLATKLKNFEHARA